MTTEDDDAPSTAQRATTSSPSPTAVVLKAVAIPGLAGLIYTVALLVAHFAAGKHVDQWANSIVIGALVLAAVVMLVRAVLVEVLRHLRRLANNQVAIAGRITAADLHVGDVGMQFTTGFGRLHSELFARRRHGQNDRTDPQVNGARTARNRRTQRPKPSPNDTSPNLGMVVGRDIANLQATVHTLRTDHEELSHEVDEIKRPRRGMRIVKPSEPEAN